MTTTPTTDSAHHTGDSEFVDLIDTSAEVAAFLTSSAAEDIISAALATHGWGLVEYSCDKPHIRPGAGVSVSYFVTAQGSDRDFTTHLTATTENVDTSGAVVTFTDPEGIVVDPIHVWQFPNDPKLPALAAATDVPTMAQVLPSDTLDANVVVYRPTRRAVIEYLDETGTIAFGKVLHPKTAAELVRRTNAVAEGSAPIPKILYSNPEGLVVSEVAVGEALSNVIAFDPARAISMIAELEQCLDALGPAVAALDEHPSWAVRVSQYAATAAELIPDMAEESLKVAEFVEQVLEEDRGGDDVATHGDFFEANVLVSDDGALTMIDLDHVGPGKRNDDWGCLLAHVSVLPFLTEHDWVDAEPGEPGRETIEALNPGGQRCSYYPRSEEVLEGWCSYLESRTDPYDLYARAAAVTMSIASNADAQAAPRESRARVRRAVWWAERATKFA